MSVACVNSPTSVTLSGDVAALEELRAVLDERSVFARRLKVDVAYHSAHMNPAFENILPRFPILSLRHHPSGDPTWCLVLRATK